MLSWRAMADRPDEVLPPTLSAASVARRPWLRPAAALALLLSAFFGAALSIEFAALHLFGAYVPPSLHVAVFVVAYEIATGSVLVWMARARLARDRAANGEDSRAPGVPPAAAVSVLIAAYNEASDSEERGIVATVRALKAQAGVSFEVLVGDDGSQDRTYDALVHAFDLRPTEDGHRGELIRTDGTGVTVRAFRFAHAGKGATLNALASRASHEVLVTLDADTVPDAHALSSLASAFDDPRVELAAGVLSVRSAASFLACYQRAEYRKNAVMRLGWSALGALEQVPGAFAGVRAESFREVGGFPTDSLTEDYELAYRLVQRFASSGRVPIVVTVPSARVFTEVPTTLGGLLRQRTRWFAGFLSTLLRFRTLIGQARAGGFGVVRFPLKVLEALMPFLAFASLFAIVHAAGSRTHAVSRIALGIVAVKWLWDLTFFTMALRLVRRVGSRDPGDLANDAPWKEWTCATTEAFTYAWLRYLAALRAYGWAMRRVRTWEPSREPVGALQKAVASPHAAAPRAVAE
jgi:cellulose synthase/poly-beta-1,6-N-acetylglucosamine synthase-like glycosyltransferase